MIIFMLGLREKAEISTKISLVLRHWFKFFCHLLDYENKKRKYDIRDNDIRDKRIVSKSEQ